MILTVLLALEAKLRQVATYFRTSAVLSLPQKKPKLPV